MAVSPRSEISDWQQSIDRLLTWRANPQQMADAEEGIPAPSSVALENALRNARDQRDACEPAPSVVTIDGEGGVAFEWFSGSEHRSLRFDVSGEIWLLVFDNATLTTHTQLA